MSCCSLGKEADFLIKTGWGLSHLSFSCTSKTVADEPYYPIVEKKNKSHGYYPDAVGKSLCDATKSQNTSERGGPLLQSITIFVLIYIYMYKNMWHTHTYLYICTYVHTHVLPEVLGT